MSWSDDMRCLHCDGKLPLYRKITNGQFCSAAHRRDYWKEQERLAVERLSQTHDSLRAYHPPAALLATPVSPAIEAIARSASNTDRVKIPGFVSGRRPDPHGIDHWMAIEPAPTAWAVSAPPLPQRVTRRSSNEIVMVGRVDMPSVDWHALAAPAAIASELAPVTAPLMTRLSLPAVSLRPELDAALLQPPAEEQPAIARQEAMEEPLQVTAPAQEIPPSETLLALPHISARDTEQVSEHVRMASALAALETILSAPVASRNTRLDMPILTTARPQMLVLRSAAVYAPKRVADNPEAIDLRASSQPGPYLTQGKRRPHAAILSTAGLQTLVLRAAAASMPGQAGDNSQAIDLRPPIELVPYPPQSNRCPDAAILSAAGLQTLVLRLAASAPGHAVDSPQAIDLRGEPGSPVVALATSSTQPGPRLAQGSRYAVREQQPAATLAGQVEPHIEAELRSALLPMELTARVPTPNAAKVVPLTCEATPRAPATAPIAASAAFSGPHLEGMKPMQPALRVDPLEGNPEPPLKRNWLSSWMQRGMLDMRDDPQEKHIWAHAVDFWAHAPRDLKLLAVAIPVLLALALHPSLPKVRVTAPTATGQIQTEVERSLQTEFVNVKQSLSERAGVALNEDFRSGLDDWQVRGERATAWSFDANGFVRPASLALYRPSMGLADYEMQFLGLIDKKALSWVVRARDFDNYYVMKLVVLKPGPLPTIGVTRYAVINGKAQNRVDTLAPIAARPDMLYRVSLDVHDDTYLLAVQGKIVDTWSEPRLARGGIGFFSPHGEESRLRWVQVTHQYDMLGRLCAYLAPYNIPTTNGSW
jgi:hypothetical protein